MGKQHELDAELVLLLPEEGLFTAAEVAKTGLDRSEDEKLYREVSRRLNQKINYWATPDNALRDESGNAILRKKRAKFQPKYLLLPGETYSRWEARTWKEAYRSNAPDQSAESPPKERSTNNLLPVLYKTKSLPAVIFPPGPSPSRRLFFKEIWFGLVLFLVALSFSVPAVEKPTGKFYDTMLHAGKFYDITLHVAPIDPGKDKPREIEVMSFEFFDVDRIQPLDPGE